MEIFEDMKRVGVVSNGVIFVGVLSVCSYVGLVEEGLSYFEFMSKEYGLLLKFEYYVCVVDIFG